MSRRIWGRTLSSLLLILSCCIFLQGCFAAGADARIVRVGYYPSPNFQDYDSETGLYTGYGYEYLQAIAQYADWQYEFVPVTYLQGIKMLEKGEIDLLNGVEPSPAMRQQLLFSPVSAGSDSYDLVVRNDNLAVAYEETAAFKKLKKIGVVEDSQHLADFQAYCRRYNITPEIIYFHSAGGVLAALKNGLIDGAVLNGMDYRYRGDIRIVAKIGYRSYYFALAKGKEDLQEELAQAMKRLEGDEPHLQHDLYEKYFSKRQRQIVLSAEEKAYLESRPLVSVGYLRDDFPLTYSDRQGNFAGAMADLYHLLSEKTGINFHFRAYDNYAALAKAMQNREIEMIVCLPHDYSVSATIGADLTPPFTSMVLLEAFIPGEIRDNTVACTPGSYGQYLLKHVTHQQAEFQQFATISECIDAVLQHKVSYTLLNNFQHDYYRGRSPYEQLSYRAVPGGTYSLSLAVSKEADPRLFSIMSKALQSLSSQSVEEIFKKAVLNASERTLGDFLLVHWQEAAVTVILLLFLLLGLAGIVYYNKLLRRKNEELTLATEAKEKFFSTVSHDMRTPLNGVIGFTELALQEPVSGRVKDYLEKIRLSGTFLLQLINDVLDISKMKNKQTKLELGAYRIDQLIAELQPVVATLAEKKGVIFTVDTADAYLGTVLLDKWHVQQIFLNLFSNAVKFTPEGGKVSFTLHSLEDSRQQVLYTAVIKDTGIGMSKEFVPRMFDAFAQERTEGSNPAMGTGLGLSIVWGLMELMKGKIEVKSELGKGTEFTLRFLVTKAKAEAAETKSQQVSLADFAGSRILVCEDNEINMELVKLILASQNFQLETAVNGAEGVKKMAASQPYEYAAILMDLRMPVMGGIEAASRIRRLDRPDAKTIPILALTADANSTDVKNCREAGMNGHIAKPIDAKILFAELARVLKEQN